MDVSDHAAHCLCMQTTCKRVTIAHFSAAATYSRLWPSRESYELNRGIFWGSCRQLSANVAFSPSRSSLGSGYSLQSGAGDDPGAADTPGGAGPSAGGAGGSWQPGGIGASVAYGPGGFPGVSDEDLAAMDPKRAKRLIANRQVRAGMHMMLYHLAKTAVNFAAWSYSGSHSSSSRHSLLISCSCMAVCRAHSCAQTRPFAQHACVSVHTSMVAIHMSMFAIAMSPISSGGNLCLSCACSGLNILPSMSDHMPGCVQSAQRSKARKLRHIMQLEEEVATLQGISAQQQATISGLQQEASLLSAPLDPCLSPRVETDLLFVYLLMGMWA